MIVSYNKWTVFLSNSVPKEWNSGNRLLQAQFSTNKICFTSNQTFQYLSSSLIFWGQQWIGLPGKHRSIFNCSGSSKASTTDCLITRLSCFSSSSMKKFYSWLQYNFMYVHCTLYTVQWFPNILHCTLYIVQWFPNIFMNIDYGMF